MLKLEEDLTHPGEISRLPRFGPLYHNNGRILLLLLLLLSPFLYGWNLVGYEFRNRLPVVLLGFSMELLSASKVQLDPSNTFY